MTHNEADRIFSIYQHGSLDREQTRAFHQHLKECETCQSKVRIQSTLMRSKQGEPADFSGETQKAMARNRDLLVKLLLLMVAAWAVYRMRR